MAHSQDRKKLCQYLAYMAVLERQIEETLSRQLQATSVHAETTAAIRRFQVMVRGHRETLQVRLRSVSGTKSPLAKTSNGILSRVSFGVQDRGKKQAVSTALQAIYTMFNHAAFGYAILHAVGHRFYDSTGEGNTADLAENHMRDYASAVGEINQLISDVVVWELGRAGLECRCMCPSCSLGICLCAPHGTLTINQAWLEVRSPAMPRGVLVRPPKADSAVVEAGLRAGDIITAAEGQEIQNLSDLQAAIRKHQPGEAIKFRVHRGLPETLEITVKRPQVST